ncbi:hypothetical protein PENTCL1PPCAC_20425, partial [Pristionchus entomophagus]
SGCTPVTPDASSCGVASCDESQLNLGASEVTCKNGQDIYTCKDGAWTGRKRADGSPYSEATVFATCDAPCPALADDICPPLTTCDTKEIDRSFDSYLQCKSTEYVLTISGNPLVT